ncbi:hypothetical protein HMPREF0239_03664 [Clostridium sp. ATCC BAA-442]|nr:hypothetical protein HMPREF0239_03664 [Clostridium sp. ATCC BAA-442]
MLNLAGIGEKKPVFGQEGFSSTDFDTETARITQTLAYNVCIPKPIPDTLRNG